MFIDKEEIKIAVYGDNHLSTRKHGFHTDYESESLWCFENVVESVEDDGGVDIVIGLGDFSFERFMKLEYRREVDKLLERLYKATKGNSFMIKGNHDVAQYGMTEYEYYIDRGLIKNVSSIENSAVKIHLLNYLDIDKTTGETEIKKLDIAKGKHNILCCHNYVKFRDTALPPFGKVIELDNYEGWFGVDYILAGHIHQNITFEGIMKSKGESKKVLVDYLGCPARPAFIEKGMDTVGKIGYMIINKESINYEIETFKLWELEKSFNIEKKEESIEAKNDKNKRVDIEDVIKRAVEYDLGVGDITTRIQNLQGVSELYKSKAIELIKGVE